METANEMAVNIAGERIGVLSWVLTRKDGRQEAEVRVNLEVPPEGGVRATIPAWGWSEVGDTQEEAIHKARLEVRRHCFGAANS